MNMAAASQSEQVLRWGERTISYHLSLEHRGDLTITVHPDLRVTVRAPDSKSTDKIQRRVHAKRAWIVRQLDDFQQYHPLPEPRRFVAGETHWYLGRQYRLRLANGPPSVRVSAGRIIVAVRDPAISSSVVAMLQEWYKARARIVFGERLGEILQGMRRFSRTNPRLRVRAMKVRWGSCTPNGTITLNTELVRASKSSIDYVIVHELCHLIVPTHSPRFFRLLDNCMPEWRKQRERLNRIRA
jgi:predicted metal-dependent hydrolase